MKTKILVIGIILGMILLSGCLDKITRPEQAAPAIPCKPASRGPADYFILTPKVLFSGGEGAITMAAFSKNTPTQRCLSFSLIDAKGKKTSLIQGSTREGPTIASFKVPDLPEGSYTIIADAPDSNTSFNATIQVRQGDALFLETDKPIYKPGQIIHGRVLSLNNDLKPVKAGVLVEIEDAKGIKVYKERLETNVFGVASFDLPLATELNLGVWKISAEAESTKTSVDVRIEKYVLPRFKAEIETPKDWFLVNEEIRGRISANYFFGKPVEGEVNIEAFKYVGTWEKYASFSSKLKDGSTEFTLPEVGYIAGTYGAGGEGSLLLNVSVTDTADHVEKTTKLLKITGGSFSLQLIPETNVIKPGLPFQVLVVTKTPDDKPLEKVVKIKIEYLDKNYKSTSQDKEVLTRNGIALVAFTPPEDAVSASINAASDSILAQANLQAVYSPSASFIHILQISEGKPKVGEIIAFQVYSTHKGTVFYDVFANGRTVYSGASEDKKVSFQVIPQMSPGAKIIAYMINPNSEVSADALPFDVEMDAPVALQASFSGGEASPGENITAGFDAGSLSMIGLSIVDESVYALGEGRLNLKQVFDELEKRFMEPQAEAHPPLWGGYATKGAYDILTDAGYQVLASPGLKVPKGEMGGRNGWMIQEIGIAGERKEAVQAPGVVVPTATPTSTPPGEPLAKVERVRQFFPETWIWIPDLMTDNNGKAEIPLTTPDTITTWRLHAVSSSSEGFGISETELRVFQDFFVEPDLPYAVTRGEEFPVQIQVYNYLNTSQKVFLELKGADWFESLSNNSGEIDIEGNSVKAARFFIKPKTPGVQVIEIVARSKTRADAVRKEIIVETEGSPVEIVENGILNKSRDLDPSLPEGIVPDSGKVFLSITPSLVAQTISGVDDLLNMPYGCGEQNMIFFAPDVEIMRYLKATGQLNPSIRAKAEVFIITGYQRELTYQRDDGSFSAFGKSDKEGSLWLTAFVLSTFSGARDITTIDENVLFRASKWIESKQNMDGSWDTIGFVHHQDMMGGVSGKYALTAYVTHALHEYGNADPKVMQKAQSYLETNLNQKNSPYALALATLTLEKLKSNLAGEARSSLLSLAKQDENGMYWEENPIVLEKPEGLRMQAFPRSSKNMETTAYAALALMEAKDSRANSALKWISSQRNSRGGFASTQDTVVAFKALMTAAAMQGKDIDAKITFSVDGNKLKEFSVSPENFDVLQMVEIPSSSKQISLSLSGKGEVNYQLVKKYHVLLPEIPVMRELEFNVTYSAAHISVNDIVDVMAKVRYVGEAPNTGMLLLDIAVPTGFAPVIESLDALKDKQVISRYEIAGRKIILYIDGLARGEELELNLKVRALFPVKAIIPDSRAYSYYNPEIKAEGKGGRIEVT